MQDAAVPDQPGAGGLLPDLLLDHATCALGRLGQMLLRLSESRLERIGLRTRCRPSGAASSSICGNRANGKRAATNAGSRSA